jgi:LemA protein
MKFYNFGLVAVLACTVVGCNAKQHAEDIGFKQGDSLVEKGTIKYDTLVDEDESCSAAWADYESNLTRRAQMVPQLVAIVRAQAANESATLTAVTQAEASATRPEIKLDPGKGELEDPVKFQEYQNAQANLGSTLSKLMVQAPTQFPNLGANQAFHDLQVQVEGTENRLLRAREQYNKTVKQFNSDLRHVSGKVINPLTGNEFKVKPYFQADQQDKAAPKLDFGTPAAATAVTPAATH